MTTDTTPTTAGREGGPVPLVLVTGGSGYVGAHTVAALLRQGYRVRTTVRSADRSDEVASQLAAAGVNASGLEFAVADLSADAGWGDAVAGADHVLHVASPFPPAGTVDNDDEIIVPARDGTLRVLHAAHDAGVRRVVMTSSFAAVGYGAVPRELYTEADWTEPTDDNTAYIRSKAIAERAAWDLVAGWGGSTELTVVNPVGIFGPALGPKLSVSLGFVKALLEGAMPVVPRQIFGVVDVRDVADLHIRAMLHPRAGGERFLAVSGMSSFYGVGQILRRRLGDLAAAVPERELTDDEVRERAASDPALRESVSQLGRTPVISSEKARRVLGWSPRDVEDTIEDSARSLIRLGLVQG